MIALRGLSMRFGQTCLLAAVDLSVPPGSRTVLTGPSGSGKTTILRLIAGLETPQAGTILLRGQTATGPGVLVPPHARRLGFAFQAPSLWPHMTVADTILYGLAGQPRAVRRQRLEALLTGLGLCGLERRRPHELSGGEAKRVSLARSLAPEPDLLLLDEPTAFLDAANEDATLAFIRSQVARSGATLLLVTHAPEAARVWADQIVTLHQGGIVGF